MVPNSRLWGTYYSAEWCGALNIIMYYHNEYYYVL